ncbi:MAG: hypothetical protein DRI32_09440 [Chloroflexi bacterium]|nr:MAG: hypothetical protein DRI32_09440 [Chloroflexota bacterium]
MESKETSIIKEAFEKASRVVLACAAQKGRILLTCADSAFAARSRRCLLPSKVREAKANCGRVRIVPIP